MENESAKLELEGKVFNNSAYHSQQAIEKAIKALLILHNQFIETHLIADKVKGLVYDKVVEYSKSLEKADFVVNEIEKILEEKYGLSLGKKNENS
jgi:HEPN domain-containing protein